ncbi:nuclear pore glycoprotein p62 [Chironomus tepperi]|uniref:nuclear pore glycoprotein p62 n=1 Tax=Chironomus tepperi TaxID=113505 RepID=UPI00391EEB19
MTSSGFTLPSTTTPSLTAPSQPTASTASLQASATLPVNQMNFYNLEDQINKYTLELAEQEKIFTNQATCVNAWDSILLKNGEKIVELNKSVEKIKTDQSCLEQKIDFINAQQSELFELIMPLENELAKIPQQIDVDRSQAYLMAETLDSQLKQMSEDLKEVIEHLNEANKFADPADPMIQIAKILNAHFTSLQWIEEKTQSINNRLDEISKISSIYQKERSFRYD